MDAHDKKKINFAWYEAQKRRPYAVDPELVAALTPGGGEWTTALRDDHYAIVWNGVDFATVSHRLGVYTAGDVAMGMRATSVADKALRSIMVLAEDAANLPLIVEITRATVAYIEIPAPRPPKPESEDDEDDC